MSREKEILDRILSGEVSIDRARELLSQSRGRGRPPKPKEPKRTRGGQPDPWKRHVFVVIWERHKGERRGRGHLAGLLAQLFGTNEDSIEKLRAEWNRAKALGYLFIDADPMTGILNPEQAAQFTARKGFGISTDDALAGLGDVDPHWNGGVADQAHMPPWAMSVIANRK